MWGRREFDYSIIRTTSKEALKRTALIASGYNIEKASELYDFFAKDINLPDTDPILPTTFEQIKQNAVAALQWGEQNQDKIIGVTNMILSALGKNPIGMPPVAPAEMPAAPPI
jgi:hypothetical protein